MASRGTIMKRSLALVVVLLAGCSTAPFADVMDCFSPGRIRGEKVPPYAGVCPPPIGSVTPGTPQIPAPITPPPGGVNPVPTIPAPPPAAPGTTPAPGGPG